MAWQKHAPALAGISMALLGAPVASAQDATAIASEVPAGAAEWTILANADHEVTVAAGLTVHGTVRYFDDAFYQDINRVVLPHRTLGEGINGSLSMRIDW